MKESKKMLSIIMIGSFCLMLTSCKQQASFTNEAQYMAGLECRAIALREERFSLANKIRFATDTLLSQVSAADSIRLTKELEVYNKRKEELTSASLSLADTIHKQLDSLRKFVFTKADDKNSFDEKLKEEMSKRGCKQI